MTEAVKAGAIPFNFMAAVSRPSVHRQPERRALDEPEIVQLLS